MKKILLLTTGGTIAATPTEQGLAPSLAGAQLLASIPQISALCQVELREVMNLDSSNMQPEEWQQLAQCVYQGLDTYDGFVIAHGTDTMAYSAAALSYMLQGLDKPVIFTGSQRSVAEADSDGPANLYDAFKVACEDKPGVYVVFAGKIIAGCRAVKLCTSSDESFFSVNAPLAGQLKEGQVEWWAPLPGPTVPRALEARCQSKVLLLKLAPALEGDMIEAAILLGYTGIVVEGYGAGNVPHLRRNLCSALAKAIRSGVAVVLTRQCLLEKSDISLYQPGFFMEEAGAIPGGDMTTEALYVKLVWALGQTRDLTELRAIMMKNIAGELGE